MFKTIYSRIICATVVITFILVTVTGAVLMGVLGDFFVKERGRYLEQEALRINDLTVFFISNRTPTVEELYNRSINDVATKINGVIYIVDRQGNVMASDNHSHHIDDMSLVAKQTNKVFSGKKIVQLGDMDGLFEKTYLTVGIPLEIRGKVVGATFLSVPSPVVNKYKYYFLKTFLITIVIVFFLVTLSLYFYSKRISKPIKEMNTVSKEIAKGNFEMKVRTVGKTDVSELAENFNKMTDSLKNLEDMRASFISNVSHELRTPMTTISGFIEGILDGTIAEEDKEKYLSIVLDETKRLARLVNKLLDLSRLEAGTLKLSCKKFDINELIRVTILRFESQINEKRLDVDIEFDKENEFVFADKDAISQVMTNLFDNAIKFNIDNGYIKIRVKPVGSKIEVSVENSGIGIEKEEIGSIFERFYKSDKSRSYDKNGMGLGLYMVKNLIANHGEKIIAESEKDRWTRFVFTLKKG